MRAIAVPSLVKLTAYGALCPHPPPALCPRPSPYLITALPLLARQSDEHLESTLGRPRANLSVVHTPTNFNPDTNPTTCEG